MESLRGSLRGLVFPGSLVACFLICVIIKTCESSEYWAENNLQQTIVLDHRSKQKADEVQQEILTLLGLHQRPQTMKHGVENSAPKFMISLYNTLQSEDDDDDVEFHYKVNVTLGKALQHLNGTDVIRSFINHANEVPHLRHDKDRTFFFDTSDVSLSETVMGAEFRVYKEAKKSKESACRIEIFRITQGVDPEDKTLEPEVNLTVEWYHEGWLSFNVTGALNAWTRQPNSNLGLYLRVTDMQRDRPIEPGKFGLIGRKGPLDQQAFMVGFFKMARAIHARVRRAIDKQPNSTPNEAENFYYWGGDSYSMENYRQKACQRRTLYVSFRSLGWEDWIIAPEGYPAFFCGGECTFPLGAHMNATNHAIVQTLVHLTKPAQVPKPCCAPTKLSSIQVLYFDEKSNVILKKYKNMKVKACGCH
nr:bone morphogenetic protein 7 [Sinonovacula constricta]